VASAPNMNALGDEYQQYRDASEASERRASAAPKTWRLSVSLEEEEEEDDDDDRSAEDETHSEGSEESLRSGAEVQESSRLGSCPLASDAAAGFSWRDERSSDESERSFTAASFPAAVDETELIKRDEVSQLDLFLHRQKFTTSAMSFFLTKVRESSVAARHAVCASSHEQPPPLPTPPDPLSAWPPLSEYEIERRSRKARRPPPPPGCLPSPQSNSLASPTRFHPRSGASAECPTLPESGHCISGSGGCAWFCPLERRLEQEMEAARAREVALHEQLRKRREAALEVDDDEMPPEPPGGGRPLMHMHADGSQTYYERRTIEEWLMNRSLARSRPRR